MWGLNIRIIILFFLLSTNIGLGQTFRSKIEIINQLKSKLTDQGIRDKVYWNRIVNYDEESDVVTLNISFEIIENKVDTIASQKSVFRIPICGLNPDSITFGLNEESIFSNKPTCIIIKTLNQKESIFGTTWFSQNGIDTPVKIRESKCEIEISPEKLKLTNNFSNELILDIRELISTCKNSK